MVRWTPSWLAWLVEPAPCGPPGRLLPRWLLLRALGLIYFSAFYSLLFQIRGLIGPDGLLPAGIYLQEVAKALGRLQGCWFAPTFLWISSSPRALDLLCWAGMAAAVLLACNIWPRGVLAVCFLAYLSFIAAAQDFSSYQSDGMLLEAGLLAWFLAPPGFRPGWGERRPPSRASLFLLQWEWFRIYFESGMAKIAGGDPQWRHLTAMDEYYQNGPLPTWIGWYVQQLPHWFHASTAMATLVLELVLVWMLFLPRRLRILCFCIVTPWELGVILTANYTFLNYLVLSLGILLLDDRSLTRWLPQGWAMPVRRELEKARAEAADRERLIVLDLKTEHAPQQATPVEVARGSAAARSEEADSAGARGAARAAVRAARMWAGGILLGAVFYSTAVELVWMVLPGFPLPVQPVVALEPFRLANRYGLFGIMTRGRYEIEFQGSQDGQNWVAYPFRYKPQDLREPPRIYAPYQPRFDWNLWFASLGPWREYPFVVHAEELLLQNDAVVLSLFAGNPFPREPPHQVRAVMWRYWFTDLATKRAQGLWWRRELIGLYAPELEREPNGRIAVIAWPETTNLNP